MIIKRSSWHYRLWKLAHYLDEPDAEPKSVCQYLGWLVYSPVFFLFVGIVLVVVYPIMWIAGKVYRLIKCPWNKVELEP
jgi:hypothetical protein